MTPGAPHVDSPRDVPVTTVEIRRARVVVRRRRAHSRSKSREWTALRSRRRTIRTAVVCAGVLVLMALGLYVGLLHQEAAAPAEGAFRPVIAMTGRAA
jgi:hypothetical protein